MAGEKAIFKRRGERAPEVVREEEEGRGEIRGEGGEGERRREEIEEGRRVEGRRGQGREEKGGMREEMEKKGGREGGDKMKMAK